MLKEQQQRTIGRLISVHTDRGVVELTKNITNFITNGFDDIHRFGQINSYVVIPFQNDFIVGEVLGVRETSPLGKSMDEMGKTITSDNALDVKFIGELKHNGNNNYKFCFGITTYPSLYSSVLYVRDEDLNAIFKVDLGDEIDPSDPPKTRPRTLKIGTSSVFPDYDIRVDIESFFSKHVAVLGNTGSGKSCTISSILQSIFDKKAHSAVGSTFVIFDTNGEYLQALEGLQNEEIEILYLSPEHSEPASPGESTSIRKEKFTLPHWFLNFDEWALLLQASEKVQLPVLRNAISLGQLFKLVGTEKEKYIKHILAQCIGQILASDQGAISKAQRVRQLLTKYGVDGIKADMPAFKFNNFGSAENEPALQDVLKNCTLEDSKIPNLQKISHFDLNSLEEIIDLAILYEESYGRSNIRNFCSSLQLRAQTLLTRNDFAFLKTENSISFKDYFFKLMGLQEEGGEIKKRTQVIIIDLSTFQDEIIEVISSVLSRVLFEGLQRIKPRNQFPLHVIIEEAHRYISEKDSENTFQAKKIFERIAKEGRKYGMSLIISSQRPSELSKTVLSQCSNYIVHRIMNPEDLAYIRKMTPYISEEVLNELPYIPRQQALIFGSAVNMPMMFRVREASPRPKSDDNEIVKHWFKGKGYVVDLEFGNFETVTTLPVVEDTPAFLPQEMVVATEVEEEIRIEDIPF